MVVGCGTLHGPLAGFRLGFGPSVWSGIEPGLRQAPAPCCFLPPGGGAFMSFSALFFIVSRDWSPFKPVDPEFPAQKLHLSVGSGDWQMQLDMQGAGVLTRLPEWGSSGWLASPSHWPCSLLPPARQCREGRGLPCHARASPCQSREEVIPAPLCRHPRPCSSRGPGSGCGSGLALKAAPPGAPAHRAGECKRCPGRQLPGGGAAPAQVAGLSPGPCGAWRALLQNQGQSNQPSPGQGGHLPENRAIVPSPPPPPPPPRKAVPGKHGLSGEGRHRGKEEEFDPAKEQTIHGAEEEDGARGREHHHHRGLRQLKEESVRQDRVQPEIARYWGSLLGARLPGMLRAGVVSPCPPGCNLQIKKGMAGSAPPTPTAGMSNGPSQPCPPPPDCEKFPLIFLNGVL